MLEEENRLFSRKVKITFLFVLFITLLIYSPQKVEAAEDSFVPVSKVTSVTELNYPILKVETEKKPLFLAQKVTNIKESIYPNLKMGGIEYFEIDGQQIEQYCQNSSSIAQVDVKQTVEKVQNDISVQLQSTIIDTEQQLEQLNEQNYTEEQIIYNCVEESEKKIGEYFLESQPAMEYTEEDVMLLATVIYAEAGICDEMEKYRVGNVVINRVNDKTDQFKDTIEGVIYQRTQFSSVGSSAWKHGPTDEEISIATELLEGKRVFPDYIVWFSKKCNYGKVYYNSEWHEFSGWELDESTI